MQETVQFYSLTNSVASTLPFIPYLKKAQYQYTGQAFTVGHHTAYVSCTSAEIVRVRACSLYNSLLMLNTLTTLGMLLA